MPILSLCIWLPIVFGVAVLVIGNDRNPAPARWVALAGSVAGFLLSLYLWQSFELTADMQFVENSPWIPRFNINYHLGVDGISMPFVILNSFMTVLVVIAHWEVVTDKVSQYLAAFLIMSGTINGVFASLDAIVFYVFFEAMLIPMFLIIGVWGGPNRVYAAVKFFLYTLLGSLLMLAAFIYLYQQTNGSFEILDFHKVPLAMAPQVLVFLAMFMSFAVKVPMWPVHTWLPDAHVEAPTAGSVILAGVLLKMGGYGFLRFSIPMLPEATATLTPLVYGLSIVAVIYASLVALAQEDMKKMIAYSSIAHMGFVTVGMFSLTQQGMAGSIFQMLSHGVVSSSLFLCVGVVYDRLHTREIARYGGLVNNMPRYAFAFMIFTMASVGLPGTSGFIGEFLVMVGVFKDNTWAAFFIATGVILGAAYMLWLYRRVIFGKLEKPDLLKLLDLSPREIALFVPLILIVLWMGIYPSSFTAIFGPSVDNLIKSHQTAFMQTQSTTVAEVGE